MSFFRGSPEPNEKAAKAAAKTATAAPTHCSLLNSLCAYGTQKSACRLQLTEHLQLTALM